MIPCHQNPESVSSWLYLEKIAWQSGAIVSDFSMAEAAFLPTVSWDFIWEGPAPVVNFKCIGIVVTMQSKQDDDPTFSLSTDLFT